MWYYITFPLLLAPLSRAYSTGFRLAAFACGALGVIVMSIPESFFLFGYGVWMLGALVRLAPRPLIKSTWLSLGVFLATAALMRLGARGPLVAAYPFVSSLADIAVAATFANLLLSLRFAGEGGLFADLSPIYRRLSDFSYSLYATHAPLAFFVWAGAGSLLGRDWYKALPTPLHWTLAFALIAAAIAIAYGFSRLTEARTKQLRDFFRGAPLAPSRSGRGLRAVELSGSRRSPLAALAPQRGPRGREAGDGHAEGRAGDVIDANLLEKGDRRGIAAVLAADAKRNVGPRLARPLAADGDEFADALLVDGHERVRRQDALCDIGAQKRARVVARNAQRRLRQIIGAKGEEFRRHARCRRPAASRAAVRSSRRCDSWSAGPSPPRRLARSRRRAA